MTVSTIHDYRPKLRHMLLISAAAGSLALPAQAAAQTAQPPVAGPEAPKPKTPAPAQVDAKDDGAIVVTGLRSSLEDALEIRRKSDVILDGISADDIGSTPDLNLGEALARIPGVQINREQGRRDATISVRGLPGNFTLTTVQGQRIASTNRGISFNSGNPFGIYDSSIFNGANVVKSFTADIPSGGLASNVDLRITSALKRKEGLIARAEVNYEETTEAFVPVFFLSGTKKFGDRFAVYGTVAYTGLNFRREAANVNNYDAFTPAQVAGYAAGTLATGTGTPDTIRLNGPNSAFNIAPVGDNGLANRVIFPSTYRQFTQRDKGFRLSAAGGFAFELNDELSVRVDGIFTRRDLSDSVQDIITGDITTGPAANPVGANQTIATPLANPSAIGTFDFDEDGIQENVFLVPRAFGSDALISIANRFFPAFEQSYAFYPQVNFENDDWRIDVIGTYSKATAFERLFNFDVRPRQRSGTRDTNNNGIDDLGTGNTVLIDNGSGRLRDIVGDINADPRLLTFDRGAQNVSIPGSSTGDARFNVALVPEAGGNPFNSPVSLLVQGFNSQVDRDLKTFDADIARKFSGSIITEVSVGGFYSREGSDRSRLDLGALGTNVAALGDPGIANTIFTQNIGVTSGGPFLGGRLPGAELDNFLSLDINAIRNTLLPVSRTPPAGVTFTPRANDLANAFPELIPNTARAGTAPTPGSAATITAAEILAAIGTVPGTGFLQRSDAGVTRNANARNNFTSNRETVELYAQSKFDLSTTTDIPVRGNFGVRYVNTRLNGRTQSPTLDFINGVNDLRAQSGIAPLQLRAGASFNQPGSARFERFLPSVNVIIDFTSNLVGRASYYETFEATDLAEFTPTPTLIADVAPGDDPDDLNAPTVVGSNGLVIPSTIVSVSSLNVEPRSSKGFDLGLSWYNRKGSVIALGFFRKSLFNDITTFRNFCPSGESLTFDGRTFSDLLNTANACTFLNDNGDRQRVRIDISLNNPDTIIVTGFEGQIQQNFDFLPGPLANTGVIANFTRIRSGGANGAQLIRVADLTYNLIGYYEDKLFQARLAYNYQTEFTLPNGGSFGGGARRVAARGQLDFSGAIKPTKNLDIRFEVFNITKASRREFLTSEQLFRNFEFDGRTYGLSATYRF